MLTSITENYLLLDLGSIDAIYYTKSGYVILFKSGKQIKGLNLEVLLRIDAALVRNNHEPLFNFTDRGTDGHSARHMG